MEPTEEEKQKVKEVKAFIKKRFGSIRELERRAGLGMNTVHNVFYLNQISKNKYYSRRMSLDDVIKLAKRINNLRSLESLLLKRRVLEKKIQSLAR